MHRNALSATNMGVEEFNRTCIDFRKFKKVTNK